MASVTFEFLRRVVPKQSARFFAVAGAYGKAKVRANTDPKIVAFERNIYYEAMHQRPKGFKPLTGPIFAEVKYVFKMPKDFPAAVRQSVIDGKHIYRLITPDITDNIGKGLFDALKDKFFGDDCTICKYHAIKIYGVDDRIVLKLSEL